jgi:hypothetical protein
MLWFLDKLLAGVLYFLVYGSLVLYVLRYIETRHRIEVRDAILFFVGLIGLTICFACTGRAMPETSAPAFSSE